ncbi:trypsin-like peptidase domain-containing protein [Candidatus Uhrbacteria bacterium]|nr:trypsin-like peptidase domain-containing protein [Candidatus Uhrbacteria bacterium]
MASKVLIDPLSASPLYLNARFGDHQIAVGTGFPYEYENQLFLVTNWHVLTGRNPDTGQPLDSETGAIPDRVRILFHDSKQLGWWRADDVLLNDENGNPMWFQHPTLGQKIDVVAISLKCPMGLKVFPLNSNKLAEDMQLSIGQDVFILGFPLGIRAGGVFPVWKRASIASEPALPLDDLPMILVDTATYEGMSGAPVLARSWGSYLDIHNTVRMGAGIYTQFVGIYSGRKKGADSEIAQIGIVWKKETINEILAAKAKGSFEVN